MSLPNKPDHLEHHSLCLDLWITQDWSANTTKALGLETHLSRYVLASLITFAPTILVVFSFSHLCTLVQLTTTLPTHRMVCHWQD